MNSKDRLARPLVGVAFLGFTGVGLGAALYGLYLWLWVSVDVPGWLVITSLLGLFLSYAIAVVAIARRSRR